jgi:hypothetical protein
MFLKNKNIENKKKVILSFDANFDYAFFSPIVSLIWSKFNYTPIIFVVWSEQWQENKLKNLIVEKSFDFGANIYFFNANFISGDDSFNGYNLSTIAQISRFCSSCIVNEDDYCLTSDIDMIPLKKDYFHSQDFSKPINIFYANGYHHLRYPICYIGMKSQIWNEVIDIDKNEDIYNNLLNIFSKGLPRFSKNEDQWGYDELFFYKQIKKTSYYPENCQMIDRIMYFNPVFLRTKNRTGIPKTLPLDRLDRSNWIFDGNINRFVDAHCKRPGYKKENWKEIIYVLSFLLNSVEYKAISDYYENFMELFNESNY